MTGGLAGKRFTKIIAGGNHSCAITDDYKAYCWGKNGAQGRLGDNTTSQRNTPTAVYTAGALAGKNVTDISSSYAGDTNLTDGEAHTCSLTSEHEIYCWGSGNSGQLGNNTTTANNPAPTSATVPTVPVSITFDTTPADNVTIVSDTQITGIAPAHAAGAVDVTVTKGTKTTIAPLGYTYIDPDAAPNPTITSVSPASGPTTGNKVVEIKGTNFSNMHIKQIDGGDTHTCAIASDNLGYCWGSGSQGELGNGSTTSTVSEPASVSTSGALSGKTLRQISVGTNTTCAIASDNLGYCWGKNNHGQLGNNSTANSSTPVAVSTSGALSGKTLKKIDTNGDRTCAIASDNELYCWGYAAEGRLGAGTGVTTDQLTPIAVISSSRPAGTTVLDVSVGVDSACYIASNNLAYCWGKGYNYQLGQGTNTNDSWAPWVTNGSVQFSKIISGYNHNCGLSTSNTLYCWGTNDQGRLGLGSGNTSHTGTPTAVSMSGVSGNITSVAAGYDHTCITTDAPHTYCTGNNNNGQLGVGWSGGTTNGAFWQATRSDGTQPIPTNPVVVATGGNHTCAINNLRKLFCAGSNGYLQLGIPGNNVNTRLVPVQQGAIPQMSISFDGLPGTDIQYFTPERLYVRTPAHAAGAVDVTLKNPLSAVATHTNAYTYITPTAPEQPTNLVATSKEGSVGLTWTAPENYGHSPITDYLVEYSQDGVSWSTFSHAPSPANTIDVTTLSPGITYTFRVSAINAIGTSAPSNTTTGSMLSLSMSVSANPSFTITPDTSDRTSSNSSTISTTTNYPSGYNLSVSATAPTMNHATTSDTLAPTSGTTSSPAALTLNSWGFRTDTLASFGSTPTIKEDNQLVSNYTWAQVPASVAPQVLRDTTTAAINDQVTVWYAARANAEKTSGSYTADTTYTTLANDIVDTTLNPSGIRVQHTDQSQWKNIFWDTFDADSSTGSWDAAESWHTAYTGAEGQEWHAYPKTWNDTVGNAYRPDLVLSTSGSLLRYNLDSSVALGGANPSPVIKNGSQYQTYGRYSARLKLDKISGDMNDFKLAWLLWPETEVWPLDGELDFPESDLGNTPNGFHHLTGQGSFCGASPHCTSEAGTTHGFSYEDWHTYTIEWTPDYVRYVIDDTVVLNDTRNVPHVPMRWQLQTETTSGTSTGDKGELLVDWVSVWEYRP